MTSREIAFGKRVLDYVNSAPTLIEDIKSFSKINDNEIIEVKFIYDRLLLLSKEEWIRIIDLARQTEIFSNLELSNIKSVRTALSKRERVKEQAVIKAYESLIELKKYGIQI